MAPRTKKPDASVTMQSSAHVATANHGGSAGSVLKTRNVNEQPQQQRIKGRSTLNTEAIFDMMDDPTGAKKKEADKLKKKEERRQKKLEKQQNQQQQEWENDFGEEDDDNVTLNAAKKKMNASSATVAVMPRVEMSHFLNKSREPSMEQPIFQRRRKQQLQQQQDSSDDSNQQLSFVQATARARELNAAAASRSHSTAKQSSMASTTMGRRQNSGAPVPRRPEEIDALLNPIQMQLHHEEKKQKQNSKSASAAPLMVRRTKRLRSDSRSCGSSAGNSVASSLARVCQQKQKIQRQSGGFMANPVGHYASGSFHSSANGGAAGGKKKKIRSSRVLHNFNATDDMVASLGLGGSTGKKKSKNADGEALSLVEERLAAQMDDDEEDDYFNQQQYNNDTAEEDNGGVDSDVPSRGTSFGSTRSGGSRAAGKSNNYKKKHHHQPEETMYEVNGRMTTTDPTFNAKKHAMKAAARQRQQQQPAPAPMHSGHFSTTTTAGGHQPQDQLKSQFQGGGYRMARGAAPPTAPAATTIPKFQGPARLAQEFDPLRSRFEAINNEYSAAGQQSKGPQRNADGNFMTPAQQQMLLPASSFAVVKFSPSWVAIGSFKTSMTNVVQCQQYPGGALLSWTQRSPKEGAFKTFNIPVDNISRLEGKKAYFEDESIRSEEQTLIVSIEGMKPSEVVFGFQNNEKAMRRALTGIGSFIPH